MTKLSAALLAAVVQGFAMQANMVRAAEATEIPPPVLQTYLQHYPGTIELAVDATNIRQKIFSVHERIPVKAGKLTLLYPEWLPGTHAPEGKPVQLGGLILRANGQRLEWRRDPLNVYAYHVEVPAGATALEADFQFLSAVEGSEGAVLVTPDMLAVHWEAMLLYPAGYYAHGIAVKANLTLPSGWQFGSALEQVGQGGQNGGRVDFKATDLETLIDSPLYAGRYFKRYDLDPGAVAAHRPPVFLDVVADEPDGLEAKPERLEMHRAVVSQAYKLFGSQHYDHYDFLMAASDSFGFAGLEHHQSGEYGVAANYFAAWDEALDWRASLVPHEYVHSWDGKFRRPSGMRPANYNEPMNDTLLWLYEGQTDYWGFVLAARSGLLTAAQVREGFAYLGAVQQHRVGRQWRAMQDTVNDPVINSRAPLGWASWQRAEDYYDDGMLMWLDADTKIRELSGDKRSLNDFARAFFGVGNGSHEPLTYTFEDVVKALNAVQPYDWAGFLRARLDGHESAPLDGFARAGWKLVYTEEPTEYFKSVEARRKGSDFSYSLGFAVNDSGRLMSVQWDGLAFQAGLVKGATLVAVDGHPYKAALLKQAVRAAKGGKQAIELLFKQDELYRTVKFDYHEGLKYPRLERIEGTPDRMEGILGAL